jgi:hypothetical protein
VTSLIKNPKDFWAGGLYLALGLTTVVIGQNYAFGTGARMGPGYFPTVLGSLLVAFGFASLARSFVTPGEGIGAIAWKPLILVTGATLLFGFLLSRAGLIVSLLVLVLISAAASEKFRFEWRPALGLIALVAFCALVFVTALGVPLPLRGSWFGE